MFFFFFDDSSNKPDHNNVSEAILSVIKKLMDGVMNNVLFKHPFIVEDFSKDKTLYAALVPNEIGKGSHFERRFTTPFGKAWQSLAVAVGKTYHGQCGQEVKVEGLVGKESLRRIQEVLNKLETRALSPNWNEELKYILEDGGQPIPVTVPARWFDMKHDPCVLIGAETWNLIGGEGTYQLFINEVNKLGKHYKERIYREYLGIEPSEGFDVDILR